MIELKVDKFEEGEVTFHIERQEDFSLHCTGMQCGVYRIKKENHPEIRPCHKVFFVRGNAKSLNRTEMKVSIQEYLMLIESINIFKVEMKYR